MYFAYEVPTTGKSSWRSFVLYDLMFYTFKINKSTKVFVNAEILLCWICIFRGVAYRQQHSNQNIWKTKAKYYDIRETLNTKTFEKVNQIQNRGDEPVQYMETTLGVL